MLHQVVEVERKGALHIGLILCRDFLWRSSIDNVSFVTDTNQKRAKHNSEVEAVSCLPLIKHVSRRGDYLWQTVWHSQLFILQIVCDKFGAVLVVVKLCKGKFCWSDCRAYKFPLSTFILGR